MIIGLTGGIGSGKTMVTKLFETMGCVAYNSDERAKELYYIGSVKSQVIELLGKEAYINENKIDRPFISRKIFSDPQLLQKLNAIMHPAVKDDFNQFVAKQLPRALIIKETAILFETNIYKEMDYTILVTAPLEMKIERVMKRNNISRNEVEKRMSAQWGDDKKIPLANAIIINDNQTPLIPQVEHLIKTLTSHV